MVDSPEEVLVAGATLNFARQLKTPITARAREAAKFTEYSP